jgi:hypothetical protein
MKSILPSESPSNRKSVPDEVDQSMQENSSLDPKKNVEVETAIAKQESKAVFRLRILVGVALLMATIGVSVGVYYFTSTSEKKEFEERFDANADKILESVGHALDRSLEAMDSFVVHLIMTAKQNNEMWPFVTMPDFCVRIAKTLSMSRAVFTSVYPMVLDNEKEAWEKYSVANDGWVNECILTQINGLNDTFFGTVSEKRDIHDYINYGYDTPASERNVYFPSWQGYPVTSEVFPPYNFDIWGIPFESAQKAVETHQASISQSYLLPNPSDPVVSEYDTLVSRWFSNFLPPDRNSYKPVIDIYYVRYYTACKMLLILATICRSLMPCLTLFVAVWLEFDMVTADIR